LFNKLAVSQRVPSMQTTTFSSPLSGHAVALVLLPATTVFVKFEPARRNGDSP
jgi:hypothetical protein